MANVVDVSPSGDPDAALLTDTATSGVLGGALLHSAPLAAYLTDVEVAHYVLRNKKSGLRIETADRPADGSAAGGATNAAAASEGARSPTDAGEEVDEADVEAADPDQVVNEAAVAATDDVEEVDEAEVAAIGDVEEVSEAEVAATDDVEEVDETDAEAADADEEGDEADAEAAVAAAHASRDGAETDDVPAAAGAATDGTAGSPASDGAGLAAAVDGDGHVRPDGDHQALAAVTDVRIVFAVGTAAGDRTTAIPLSEVAAVEVDGGLLSSELVITTADDDEYGFSCRGDLEEVLEFVDVGSQAWTRAYSLLDDARDALAAAEAASADAAFGDAVAAIDEGVAAVESARERIAAFGDGAATALEPTVADLERRLERRRREIHADHGVHAHKRARDHWGHRRYEQAHEAYHEAMAALERAQELEETTGIADRLDRIEHELDDLADAPLSYASAMVEEARDSDDAQTTAQCWAVAIERYRDVYALDWGREDERFRGDPTAIRERVLSALDELVKYRVAGTEDRLEEAEWLRQSDDIAGAREVLADALAAIDRTERLVDELSQDDYPELAAARREVRYDLELLPET